MATYHDKILGLLGLGSVGHDSIMFYLVTGGWIFTVIQFLVTVFIPAPYGRHAKNAPKYLTCKKLPQRILF